MLAHEQIATPLFPINDLIRFAQFSAHIVGLADHAGDPMAGRDFFQRLFGRFALSAFYRASRVEMTAGRRICGGGGIAF